MTLFLSKLLPPFLYPLGLALLLALVALVFGRFRRLRRVTLLLAILLLWLPSMPVTANLLALSWEAAYPPAATADLPEADAIVVLGGIAAQPLPPRIVPDLGGTADRLFETAHLFRAGKAAHIVVSAGNLPWGETVAPEAQWIARLLGELGVPAETITLEQRSRNTHENALFTAAILRDKGWRSVLLVTSADHMRRAMATFRKAGVSATAAPADVQARTPVYDGPLDVLPNADALTETTAIVKEMIGLVYYRLRGWV
jgi:uncharacterized SAM-binding protein YcdF (DUF218 family)